METKEKRGRYIAAAFTGYRPSKMPFPQTAENIRHYQLRIKAEVERQAALGVRYFMSGMCNGADLWAAEAVLAVKREKAPHIGLYAIVPFEGQDRYFSPAEKETYRQILAGTEKTVVLSPPVSGRSAAAKAFDQRNRYMVDHCDVLIALCEHQNIKPGGTRNTVRYAEEKGKTIVFIPPVSIGWREVP